jgi:hypothetical protein
MHMVTSSHRGQDRKEEVEKGDSDKHYFSHVIRLQININRLTVSALGMGMQFSGRALASHAQGSGLNHQHCENNICP